jgi:hypothetical protein
MLNLPVNTIGPLLTLADDAAPGRYAAASARPRLARQPDGKPALQLRRWIPSSGSSGAAPGFARLTLTVQVSPLAQEVSAAGLSADAVRPMPWVDAAIELMGPRFEPVRAEVAVAAGSLGVVSTDLPPESASVLASLLTREVVSPLQVTWKGSVLVRLPAVEVVASASIDTKKIRSARAGPFSSYQERRSLIEANAHVEIRGVSDAALEAAFRDWALGELTRHLEEGRDLSVRAEAAQVVRWPIQLATTLDDLLSAGERQGLVETAILDPSELGQSPPLEVRALGDFGGRLERVDVRLNPIGGGAAKELSLTSDAAQRVGLGTAQFSWSYRAKLVSQPAGAWSEPREASGSYSLLIPVPAAPELRVEALASGIDFARRWSSIRIELAHQAAPPDGASTVLQLDAGHPSAAWTRSLAGPRGNVKATLTFVSREGESVQQSLDDVPGEQLVVSDPLDGDRLRVPLMPAGNGWDGLAVAMIDLRYRDGQFCREETVEMRSAGDFIEWETPARSGGPRAIDWRCHASYLDGRFVETAWQTVESGVLAVPLQAPATREVQLLPVFFDISRTVQIDVRLLAGGRVVTQPITSPAAVRVTLPPGPYRWALTWRMKDGTTAEMPEQQSDDDVIVLPRHP